MDIIGTLDVCYSLLKGVDLVNLVLLILDKMLIMMYIGDKFMICIREEVFKYVSSKDTFNVN